MKDILIIGGGPAGLTAAIYAARAGRRAVILEKETVGGQITSSPAVENYPGIAHISGADLARLLEAQARELGTEILGEEALSVQKEGTVFTVVTDRQTHRAAAVILAAGVAHRGLGLPGEEELIGCGLAFCAVCDGAFYKGRDVAVVGGGDAALQDALFLSQICRSVTLIHRRDEFRGEAMLVDRIMASDNIDCRMETVTEEYLTEDGMVTGLKLLNKRTGRTETVRTDCVFLAVGQKPQNGFLESLISLTSDGYADAGEDTHTSVPGLFAAGDCRRKKIRQLTTASADGAVAALAACDYLDRL